MKRRARGDGICSARIRSTARRGGGWGSGRRCRSPGAAVGGGAVGDALGGAGALGLNQFGAVAVA